jgi:hypothetical protein
MRASAKATKISCWTTFHAKRRVRRICGRQSILRISGCDCRCVDRPRNSGSKPRKLHFGYRALSRSISDSVPEELDHPFVRNRPKEVTNVGINTQLTFFLMIPTHNLSNASCWLRPGRNPYENPESLRGHPNVANGSPEYRPTIRPGTLTPTGALIGSVGMSNVLTTSILTSTRR